MDLYDYDDVATLHMQDVVRGLRHSILHEAGRKRAPEAQPSQRLARHATPTAGEDPDKAARIRHEEQWEL